MHDPNFPPNLDIRPLQIDTNQTDSWLQTSAIEKYGIAGRVWEATTLLINYIDPRCSFDPSCSIHSLSSGRRILELGSGQCVASLQLADFLKEDDVLVVTDLPEVIPLCKQSIAKKGKQECTIIARPLAWGSSISTVRDLGPYTHILLCDLIYFPQLYPPLLRTLLELTDPASISDEETFGPEIILCYKPRTLALEESFFEAFIQYFRMVPVVGATECEERLYLCHRWRIDSSWRLPEIKDVMNGGSGVIRGTSFGFAEQLYASLDW